MANPGGGNNPQRGRGYGNGGCREDGNWDYNRGRFNNYH
jgi:hypothetical protein